ncbi:hypothetical protein CF392_15945, partial [Tamilnaduibacter salinus]
MVPINRKSIALTSALLVCANTQAGDLRLNGFASFGGGQFEADDSAASESYQGFDDNFTMKPVTKIALQATAEVNKNVTVTGQLLASGNDDYNMEAEWAYLTYEANRNLDLRVGRLRSPFFRYSDSLDVGYAYPWVAPPRQVYRFIFDTVEGVDAVYNTRVAGWNATAQAYYGRLQDETVLLGEEVDLDLTKFTGVNLTLDRDWLTFRASYNRADFDVDAPADLAAVLSALPNDVAEGLRAEDEVGEFWGVAAEIDYANWLFISE